ncbi:outer membrane lipoprotein-sorting protein [bacterium]|nr:outer membrane lipoprotein-sorting protein [bacterium]
MRNRIKKLGVLFGVLLILPLSVLIAETPQEKGWQIMKAVDEMPTVEKMTSEAIFSIYDSQEKLIFTKKSRAATLKIDYKDPEKRLSRSISYFFSPADDKGNGALNIEHAGEEDDDQWIYLKGLRKPKRVIGSDKSSSFMGSDFSNGDVAARDIEDSVYTWLGSEDIVFKGKKIPVEKIEAEFKDQKKKEDYGYSKNVIWIHAKTGLVFKGEMYDLNNQLSKTMNLLSFTVQKNRDGESVFLTTGIEMKNVLKGTKTIMESKNIRVEDQTGNVDPSIFNISYLTRKWW